MANQSLQAMLRQAAAQLGISEEQLLQRAKDGTLGGQLQKNGQNGALRRALSDPQEAQRLLQTPQAQKLLQMLQKDPPKS